MIKEKKYFTVDELLNRLHPDVKHAVKMSELILINIHLLVVNKLDIIREDLGKPIEIQYGYRPPIKNKDAGGVRNSYHITGSAVDFFTHDRRDLLKIYDNIINKKYFDEWGECFLYKSKADNTSPIFIHLSLGHENEQNIYYI